MPLLPGPDPAPVRATEHEPDQGEYEHDGDERRERQREALDRRERPSDSFWLEDNGQSRTDEYGLLQVTPGMFPVDNILSHDGTNISIEKEMAELAETAMVHQMAAEMLASRFNGLRKAIRGNL